MGVYDYCQIFALLIFGHYLADFPLQGAYLAAAKNRFKPLEGTPWYQAMTAHVVVHGGMVGLVTGSLLLALAEILLHALIDDRKCAGRFGYDADQALHWACKALWVMALALCGTQGLWWQS